MPHSFAGFWANEWESTNLNLPAPGGNRAYLCTVEPAKPDPADLEERRAALLGIVRLRKDRTDLPDTETCIRTLRVGTRLERLQALWSSEPIRESNR